MNLAHSNGACGMESYRTLPSLQNLAKRFLGASRVMPKIGLSGITAKLVPLQRMEHLGAAPPQPSMLSHVPPHP